MKYKTQREIVLFLLKYKMSFIPFDTDLEMRGHFGLEGQWQFWKNSLLSWVKSLDVGSCLTSCWDLEQAAEIWVGVLGWFGFDVLFCFQMKFYLPQSEHVSSC